MSDLHYTDSARVAAHRLLKLPAADVLDEHWVDDGRLLTLSVDGGMWERMSSGQRVLVEVLEAIGGHRSTVTWFDIAHRLDDPCKAAVIEALALLCGMRADVAEAAA